MSYKFVHVSATVRFSKHVSDQKVIHGPAHPVPPYVPIDLSINSPEQSSNRRSNFVFIKFPCNKSFLMTQKKRISTCGRDLMVI